MSVAASPIPAGPFVDTSSAPLVCQLPNGGSIDPSPFRAANGTTYLLWKSDDNALGRRTQLWGQQLGNDGRAVVGPRVVLLAQSQSWQAPVIEGPSMVAAGGLYYLFYGAGAWDSAGAAIGYARCLSPLGPCVNASVSGPWMASHGKAIGPSGPEVFIDATGAPRLAYHAWTGPVGYQNGGSRSLWIDTLRFSGVTPAVT
jgi:beta-xylosidase